MKSRRLRIMTPKKKHLMILKVIRRRILSFYSQTSRLCAAVPWLASPRRHTKIICQSKVNIFLIKITRDTILENGFSYVNERYEKHRYCGHLKQTKKPSIANTLYENKCIVYPREQDIRRLPHHKNNLHYYHVRAVHQLVLLC